MKSLGNHLSLGFLGIPDHHGVINVGGRVGAARGPEAFRKSLARLRGRDGVHAALQDLGDAWNFHSPPGGPVESSHRRAADRIRDLHQAGKSASVIVGGGHDHGYSQLLGLREALPGKKIGCINIDAHLDVRAPAPPIGSAGPPVAGSGSPFYLAIEAKVLDPALFVEFGIQAHCNSSELWDYVEGKGVRVVPFEELRHGAGAKRFREELERLASLCDHVVVSLDLDAASSAFAPGVSAPQSEGFTATDFVEIGEISGLEPKVISLGIFELNPELDPDDRTARLAATVAYHFTRKRLSLRS